MPWLGTSSAVPRSLAMHEARENPTFMLEAVRQVVPRQGTTEKFDRAASLEAAIAAVRQPDFAHSAAPDEAIDGIGTDLGTCQRKALPIRQQGAFQESLGVQDFELFE